MPKSYTSPVFYAVRMQDGEPVEIAWASLNASGTVIAESHAITKANQIPEGFNLLTESETANPPDLPSGESFAVTLRMMLVLAGKTLFSASTFDGVWLEQMFEGLGLTLNFLLKGTAEDLFAVSARQHCLGHGSLDAAFAQAKSLPVSEYVAETMARRCAEVWQLLKLRTSGT